MIFSRCFAHSSYDIVENLYITELNHNYTHYIDSVYKRVISRVDQCKRDACSVTFDKHANLSGVKTDAARHQGMCWILKRFEAAQ